ncbi:hypothetical protein FC52_GL001433 [Lactobacillus pasteurii DSM 23907 = CRBIP 24.76]|nr:hypothetical protein FC52_GL001433 [Lactobacillus pasteurii DSM 23907 = CRBIP 24.76]
MARNKTMKKLKFISATLVGLTLLTSTGQVQASRLSDDQAKQAKLAKIEQAKQVEYEALLAQVKNKTKATKVKKTVKKKRKKVVKKTTKATPSGKINTANTGKIVGNIRSKIYHVPGQSGYRMNSTNAIYFNSEKEAIAAGYRKAKR